MTPCPSRPRGAPSEAAVPSAPAAPAAALASGLALALALGLPSSRTASAHEGHDHGDAPPPAASAAGAPRFVLASDGFELVGAVDGRRVTLWVDRAADNAPVIGATIELEIAGTAVAVRAQRDVYVGELAASPAAGRVPVVATVVAGADADLLAGEWIVDAPPTGALARTGPPPSPDGGRGAIGVIGALDRTAVAVAGGAAALAGLLGWWAGRRRGMRGGA